MVKVGVLGYFSPCTVAHSWVRRLGLWIYLSPHGSTFLVRLGG